MRILLVEPEENRSDLRSKLAAERFSVDFAANAEDAALLARDYLFDAIIFLHTSMTSFHIREVRDAAHKTAIVVIDSSGNVRNIVLALGAGADDYMVAPIAFDELVARVHAIVRRHNEQYDDVAEIGKMKVDFVNHATWIDEQLVYLTPKSQHFLEILARRKGKLVSRETLFNLLYGTQLDVPEPKILDVFLCRLRRSLQVASDGGRYIRCEWTRGYIIDDPVVPRAGIKKTREKRIATCAS